jgi:hypothetical protein
MSGKESVPSIAEADALGETAEIYADIRNVLGTSVVNLIWRYLATMPGALRWTWDAVRPIYTGPGPRHAEAIRRTLNIPAVPAFSAETLAAAGLGKEELTGIGAVLDSYQYTNALAIAVLSSLLAYYEPQPQAGKGDPWESAPAPMDLKLPPLPPMDKIAPPVMRLIEELNSYGEDEDPRVIVSMPRHLSFWPAYLALSRTMLGPLEADGQLRALTQSTRTLARAHGSVLAQFIRPATPPSSLKDALAACRHFVDHPIARMTGICTIMRRATPEPGSLS